MKGLAGRVALVTGAAQGIGRAIARRFALEGARTLLADSNDDELSRATEALRDELPDAKVRAVAMDVGKPAQVARACDDIQATDGPIAVLVNNAGILRDGWIDNLEDDDWESVLRVNLGGAFYCSRAVVPQMKATGYGRIVSLSSRAWMGNPGQSNYSAAKAGVVGLTRALALELARFGITVNAVAPGMIDSPMTRALRDDVRERLVAQQPGGRMGTTDEVAATVAFLASEESSFITGQVIQICGGKSLGMGGVA